MEEQSHRPGHIQLGAHRVHQRGEGGRGGVRKHTENERCESWRRGNGPSNGERSSFRDTYRDLQPSPEDSFVGTGE